MAPGPPALPLWKRLDLNCSKAGMRLMVRVLCSCPGEEKVYTRESVFSPIAVWSAIVPVCCTALLTTSWRMWIHWYIHTQANTLLPGIRNASSTFSCSTVLFHFTLFCMEQTLHVWNLAALKLRFTKTTGLCLLFSGKENKELPSLATRWFVLVPFFRKTLPGWWSWCKIEFCKKKSDEILWKGPAVRTLSSPRSPRPRRSRSVLSRGTRAASKSRCRPTLGTSFRS